MYNMVHTSFDVMKEFLITGAELDGKGGEIPFYFLPNKTSSVLQPYESLEYNVP